MNAGGEWDEASHQATYRAWPDKESPLWNPHSQIIYWWTATIISIWSSCRTAMVTWRAGLVARAEDWAWSSLRLWLHPPLLPWLDVGPVPRHPGWREYVQVPHSEAELAALRRSVERSSPFGSPGWVERTAAVLGLESSLHSPGRPRKRASPDDGGEGLFLGQQP